MTRLSPLLNLSNNRIAGIINGLCILAVALLTATASYAQSSVSVSGYVRESGTGETVAGALVETESGRQAVTNRYGFFTLPISDSDGLLTVSSIGYEPFSLEIKAWKQESTDLNIILEPCVYNISGAVVVGDNISLQRAGRIEILPLALKSAATLGGEHDMMKFVQQFPGIQATSEGKSSLSIRGGAPGENLILLDGVPVYSPEHVFGFISVFNADAVKKVTVYKSNFPAKYGGRISSVIDVSTKDGNKSQYHGNASIGLLSAKVDVEGPIIKDKLSFSFSARRSYADLFLIPLEKQLNDENDGYTDMAFYDLNAKLHYQISPGTFASIQAYLGRDKCYYSQDGQSQDTKWGNAIISAAFNKKLNDKLFLNSSVSYDSYHYGMLSSKKESDEDEETAKRGMSYDSDIKDITVSSDFEFVPSSTHSISFGGRFSHHKYSPDVVEIKKRDTQTSRWEPTRAEEIDLYAEDEINVSKKFGITLGMNLGAYIVKGASYFQLDPRLSFSFDLSDNITLVGGYSRMHQNNHLLSNNSLLLQSDMWVPATSKVKPMKSDQLSLDINYSDKHIVDASVSLYYKNLKGVIDYLDGASFSGTSVGWEDKVIAGVGRAYGIEFYAKKTFRRWTLTASYTLSKSEQKFDLINFGNWYPSKNDRRHYVDISLDWNINERLSLFSHWVYSTGNMMTVPMMSFVPADIPDEIGYFPDITLLEGRNNFRMPPQHRLDIGLLWIVHSSKQCHGELSFNVYNVYNRRNPYQIYVIQELVRQEDGTATFHQRLKQVSLFPIVPSVSYSFYF